MSSVKIVECMFVADPLLCGICVLALWRRGLFLQFAPVGRYLAARIVSNLLLLMVTYETFSHISDKLRYQIYFPLYWGSYLLETLLGFGIILSIYRLSMAPLVGLQRLGMLMFRWAGLVAVAMACALSFGPKLTMYTVLQRGITQLQQTASVLTLCMLLFVCLASRPMGLSTRSRVFGVSLGLGLVAAIELASSAWLAPTSSFGTLVSLLNGSAGLLMIMIWTGYFLIPEPKRRMIVLPTTSPFLRWNQISLALGDEPGFVAIGEVSPDMFAPAEVEIMRRASLKMRQASN